MSELIGIARFRFHPGKVEEYKRLSEAAMEIVRAREPGTLEYSIFFNADETAAVVIERFRDADALLEHGQNMAEIGAQVLATGTVEGELLGEVNAEIAANLAQGEQPKHYLPWIMKDGRAG
jgi:quinol monooxygenase YgiN